MWVEFITCIITAILMFAIGMYCGKNYQRKAITGDFDTIIRRAKHMLRAGEIAKLDMFLHELTEDTDYIPNAGLQRLDVLIRQPYTNKTNKQYGDEIN